MMGFQRYALYWAPEPGPLADFTAAWLGWDPVRGAEVAHPDLSGLPRPVADLTATPRKYGFHGTLKAPFRLIDGARPEALDAAARAVCNAIPAVDLPALELRALAGFLALVPSTRNAALDGLAAALVQALDAFRAPLSPADMIRRKADRLSPAQRDLLARYGYPYVLDEFRFHLTLTGALPGDEAEAVRRALAPALAPLVPAPFRIGSVCLFGEAADGRFHVLSRYRLAG